jgi:hypothetical protein
MCVAPRSGRKITLGIAFDKFYATQKKLLQAHLHTMTCNIIEVKKTALGKKHFGVLLA